MDETTDKKKATQPKKSRRRTENGILRDLEVATAKRAAIALDATKRATKLRESLDQIEDDLASNTAALDAKIQDLTAQFKAFRDNKDKRFAQIAAKTTHSGRTL